MTEKKRASVYDPVAQKKWSDKNRAKKNVNTRRSNAKRFIREDATLEELEELQALIEERKTTLEGVKMLNFRDEKVIDAVALESKMSKKEIELQRKGNGIWVLTVDEFIEQEKEFCRQNNYDEESTLEHLESYGATSWDDLKEQVSEGFGSFATGLTKLEFEGARVILVTPL